MMGIVVSLGVLFGGAFILWTAIKEIYHLLAIHEVDYDADKQKGNSVGRAVSMIVIMNLVFSFDSILSAMALTKSMAIMALAWCSGSGFSRKTTLPSEIVCFGRFSKELLLQRE